MKCHAARGTHHSTSTLPRSQTVVCHPWPKSLAAASLASTLAGEQHLECSGNALWQEDHQQHQHRAHHETPLLRYGHYDVLQRYERKRADHRADKSAAATEHCHEHEVAGMGPVSEFRIGQTRRDSKDGAADAAIDCRDNEGSQAHTKYLYANVSGFVGVLADRPEMQSERRFRDPPHH